MVCEGDASSVQHLQEKIPYQPVRLFDFVEKQDALLVSCEQLAKATDTAGFVAHEELHIVQVKKFGHIESEDVTLSEQVAGEFQSQSGFTDTCRTKEKE
jgi:hypothetical protein